MAWSWFDKFKHKKIGFIQSKKEFNTALTDERYKSEIEKLREEVEKLKREKPLEDDSISNMMQPQLTTPSSGFPTGFDKEIYLYDFVQEYGNIGGHISLQPMSSAATQVAWSHEIGMSSTPAPDNKYPNANGSTLILPENYKMTKERSYKPIDVWEDLKDEPSEMNLENLDDKIMVLKAKEKLVVNNTYAKKETIHMQLRLENRKKWDEFKHFYNRFDNTTMVKVQDLVNKYKFAFQTSDLFIPKFPDVAIKIMDEYVEQTMKLCGKKPVFYVIAEQSLFKNEFKRNDPILLVQSPFGYYWQILGAWDAELILLSEL